MTPEEKAKELIQSFIPYMYCYRGSGMLSNDYDLKIATDNAKICARLAVDEIIKTSPTLPLLNGPFFETKLDRDIDATLYWEKVKQAIINTK